MQHNPSTLALKISLDVAREGLGVPHDGLALR